MSAVRYLITLANRHAGRLALAGLLGIGIINWRSARRDRRTAERLRDEYARPPILTRLPRISVLVAAWNEAAMIEAHLHSFQALSYPDIELILCAGGSDDTLRRARQAAGRAVHILEQQAGEGKQQALARCAALASGEIIYLTDADCLYDDLALRRLLEPLIEQGEQAASGSARPLDRQRTCLLPRYLWASDRVASAYAPHYSAGLLGRNAAITRQALQHAGGLNFVARTGTDYQLARRLIARGIAIRAVPASVIATTYPTTLADYRRRQGRWLRNVLIHGWRHGAYGDVRATLITVATGVLMLLGPLAALAIGQIALAVWGLLLAHALGSKLRYLLFSARLDAADVPIALIVALPALTMIDFAIWALPLLDLIDPRRREQW